MDDGSGLQRIHQVALKADDLDASLRFYRDALGLHFLASFDPPGLAFLELDGIRLMLSRNATPATLYFRVADVHAAVAALQAKGVTLAGAPQLIHRDVAGQFGPPGSEEWMAFFHDPAGNTLALAATLMPAAVKPDREPA